MVNRTKQSLLDGRAVIGPFVYSSDPTIVELAGLAGFDFVVIDMEHTANGLTEVQQMVRAAETRDVTPIVRVPEVDEKLILRVLETGAQGVMVPLLETPEQARRAVRAMRYPPTGRRGTFSHNRPSGYGLAAKPLTRFFAESNDEVLLIGLIETPEGINNAESILAEGIDVGVVGRGDLSSFMGFPGQPAHPAVVEAATRALSVAANASPHRWAGIAGTFDNAEIDMWGSKGCRFFLWGDDWSILLGAWRAALEERRPCLALLGAPSGSVSRQSAGSGAAARQ